MWQRKLQQCQQHVSLRRLRRDVPGASPFVTPVVHACALKPLSAFRCPFLHLPSSQQSLIDCESMRVLERKFLMELKLSEVSRLRCTENSPPLEAHHEMCFLGVCSAQPIVFRNCCSLYDCKLLFPGGTRATIEAITDTGWLLGLVNFTL